MPRLATDNLQGDLSDQRRRRAALLREANRIGAKLDLLFADHDAPVSGETLAHWLGVIETTRVRHNSSRWIPKDKTWSYLVQRYIDTFESESIAREGNLADTVRRLEAIRDLDFCQGRFSPDISPDEWDEFFDSLTAERPDVSRGETTRLVLDAARNLLRSNPTITVPCLTEAVTTSAKRQSIEARVRVLVREGWLTQNMAPPRRSLKRKVRMLGPGPRFDQPFLVARPKHSARTVNKMRALVRRIYDFGIRHRMFGRENLSCSPPGERQVSVPVAGSRTRTPPRNRTPACRKSKLRASCRLIGEDGYFGLLARCRIFETPSVPRITMQSAASNVVPSCKDPRSTSSIVSPRANAFNPNARLISDAENFSDRSSIPSPSNS